MIELWPATPKDHREGAGIPRLLAVPAALTVAMALTIGGAPVAAGAEEVAPSTSEPVSSTPEAEEADSSDLSDTAEKLAQSPTVREIASDAVSAAKRGLATEDPVEPQQADHADATTESTADSTEDPVEANSSPDAVDPSDPTDPVAPDPSDDPVAPGPSDDPVAPGPSDDPVAPGPSDDPVAPDPSDDPVAPVPSNSPVAPDPSDPTDPPGDPSDPTDDLVNEPTEGTTQPDPIPVRPGPRTTPKPPSAAAAAAAAAARAEQARAVSAAQSTFDTARMALDSAKRAFASTTAEFDAAQARADQIHKLAEKAAATATRSQRALGAVIRSIAQQAGSNAQLGVILESPGGADLLYQFGTLEKLEELTENLEAIRARADADQRRADTLAEQDAAAQARLQSIPLEASRAELQAAEAQFDAASTALASLRTSSPVGLVGLTPITELIALDTGQLSDQGWAHPAIGRVTDGYGPRPERPVPGVGPFHYGTDIGAACNAGIYAATSGVVEAAGSMGTYGNWILLNHGNGIQTGYAHIGDGTTLVSIGEPVIAGQVIGGVGSTGASTGCHLHFEVRIDATRVDAESFMAQRGVVLGATDRTQ